MIRTNIRLQQPGHNIASAQHRSQAANSSRRSTESVKCGARVSLSFESTPYGPFLCCVVVVRYTICRPQLMPSQRRLGSLHDLPRLFSLASSTINLCCPVELDTYQCMAMAHLLGSQSPTPWFCIEHFWLRSAYCPIRRNLD